jgi:5'-methylthioadenosine phosphorylase
MVTDYDCWMTGKVVDGEEVIKTMRENIGKVRTLLSEVIPRIPRESECSCRHALDGAVM